VDVDAAKRAAGEAAAQLVEDGACVGLGTGSTARWFITALGRRVHEGLRVRGVPTSEATRRLAMEHGIPIAHLGAEGVDIAVDGADQVDTDLRLIKGGGGAMVRERIVAAAARQFVVVVDESKLREHLEGAVPLEIMEFGADRTLAVLAEMGSVQLRLDSAGGAVRSDNGNLLADAVFSVMDDPDGLAARLDTTPGVVGHGFFLGMADRVLVGGTGGVRELRRAAVADVDSDEGG
jgi:ribose 5-phosphate isomerase A